MTCSKPETELDPRSSASVSEPLFHACTRKASRQKSRRMIEPKPGALKKLISHPSLAHLRYQIWRRDARQDAAVAANFARAQKMPLVNIFSSPIFTNTGDTTLFILGSGWSVNSMSQQMFAHIAAHQSVGINYWFFHDFVPTAFSFDAGKVANSEKSRVKKSLDTIGRLFSREPILAAQPNILLLRPYQSNSQYLVPVPEELRPKSWVSGRANLLSSGATSLSADLRVMVNRIGRNALPPAALPDNGSSVVRLIFLALAQGFRDIVLVGIDLNAQPHFWFAPEYVKRYPEYVALFPEPDNKPHGTTGSIDRPIGNLEFIETLNRILVESQRGKLWAASPHSQLGDVLPQYPWPQ